MRIGPFGVWEILIILVVVLLIFGPRRLPEMAKGLGQSVRAFRKEMRDFKNDFDDEATPAPERPSKAAADASPKVPPVVNGPVVVDEPPVVSEPVVSEPVVRDRATVEKDAESKPV